ncbi:MAG: L-glutamate gamma-semialdehyde dehydrogenase [Candidatus Scalinduaceae bacterium]
MRENKHLFDEEIQQLGLKIFQLIGDDTPSIFKKDWWSGKILDWCIRHPTFKVQMFRLVDVLPNLKSPHQISQHIREYFSQPGIKLPSFLKLVLDTLINNPITGPLAASMIRNNVQDMAGRFIIAPTPRDALPRLRALWDQGTFFTLDILGEAVVSEKEALDYQKRYQELFDELRTEIIKWPVPDTRKDIGLPRLSISVKLSSLYSQMDPVNFAGSIETVKERLRPIFRKAKEYESFINIDMEHYKFKDLTIAIFKSLLEEEEFSENPRAGIVIQTYLKDSGKDLKELIDWARERKRTLTVRLVKGAYWDYEQVAAMLDNWPVPVFLDKRETDNAFEEATRQCLENYPLIYTAIASHNVRSLAHGIIYAKHLDHPPAAFEIQMLYGMADPIKKAILQLGYNVCEYVPIGEFLPGISYFVRRLMENTSNESFLRQTFTKDTNVEELLCRPEPPQVSPEALKEKAVSDEEIKPFHQEPLHDFARINSRNYFRNALEKVQTRLGKVYPLLIDGKEVHGENKQVSINPSRPSQVIGHTFLASKEEAERAVAAARKAFIEWRETDTRQRGRLLLKIAENLRSRRGELAALQVLEVSKTWREADADVCEAIDFCEYYAREMIRLGRPCQMDPMPGENNLYSYQPRGVALVIAPWNFPLAISTGMSMAALVTGNTVIYKPSSLSPITGAFLARVVNNTEIPHGIFQYLPCSGIEVTSWMVEHPDVDVIAFTGSKEVGLEINQKASVIQPGQRGIKKVVAEMGGKNAIIVDEDADLDAAVTGVVQSAFGFQGQKCSACSRVIVLEDTYDRFRERTVEATRSLQIGDPMDPATQIGAIIDDKALKKISNFIEIGKSEGRMLFQAECPKEGFFIGPTIFEGILPHHRLAREEIFGPVLAIMRVKDLDEALEVANGTEYALTGGLYSRSPDNIKRVISEFRVGNLYINRKITGALVGRQPFGGFKMSGIGSKAGGPDYVLQFMEPLTITENTIRKGFSPEIG